MCFLYQASKLPPDVFQDLQLVDEISEHVNQRLIYPMYQAPLVRRDGDVLLVETREWGWLPAGWHPSDKYKTRKKYQRERINARCETVHTTWGFKQEFARGQRCILLADAFHEPFQGTDGNWFACDPPMIGIAGLWADYQGDESIQSCTMLTTDANEFVREHRTGRMRMPVLLGEETARQWLDPDRHLPGDFQEVFRPLDPSLMKLVDPPESKR